MSEVNINNNGCSTGNCLCGNGYLIIIGGQSNGTDRFTISGNLPAANQGTQIDCYTYFKTADTSADNGSWVQMNAGVNTQTGTPQTGMFSLGISMANRLKTTYNKKAFIVPTAVGGTYIANDVNPSWNTTHTGQYYDRMLIDAYRWAISKLCNLGNLTPVLLWVHGESDSDTVSHGNAYYANVAALIAKFRVDSGYPNMKVVISRLRSNYGGANLGLSAVRQAQVDLVANLSNVYMFDTETNNTTLSSDLQHYNPIVSSYSGTQSAINLGNGIADLIATF